MKPAKTPDETPQHLRPYMIAAGLVCIGFYLGLMIWIGTRPATMISYENKVLSVFVLAMIPAYQVKDWVFKQYGVSAVWRDRFSAMLFVGPLLGALQAESAESLAEGIKIFVINCVIGSAIILVSSIFWDWVVQRVKRR